MGSCCGKSVEDESSRPLLQVDTKKQDYQTSHNSEKKILTILQNSLKKGLIGKEEFEKNKDLIENKKSQELEEKLEDSVKKGLISQPDLHKWKRRVFLEEWYTKNIKNEQNWNKNLEEYFKIDQKKPKEDPIVYNEDGTVSEASLDQILELLLVKTDHKISEQDMYIDLQDLLFSTSRLYVKDEVLLRKIVQFYFKYKIKASTKISDSLCVWINTCFSVFSSQVIGEMIKFAIQTDIDEDVVTALEHALSPKNISVVESELPQSLNDDYTFNILDWSPMEIARQITMVDMKLLNKIQPDEYIFYNLKDEKNSHNLTKFMKHTRNMYLFTCEMILLKEDEDNRVEHLMYAIDLIDSLISIRNYHSAMNLYNALLSKPVFRLSKTWMHIAEESEKIFKSLQELASPKRNYKNLKDAISKYTTPCVPYIEAYLSEIEPNPRETQMKINVNHKRKVCKTLTSLLKLQQRCIYNFKNLDLIQDVIMMDVKEKSEEEFKKISLKLEY